MLLSRSIFSATSAPVSPPGNCTFEYFLNTDCRRACTMNPMTPMAMIRTNMPIVAAS
jgi:hypothetical protein